jgi:hypothetical protein
MKLIVFRHTATVSWNFLRARIWAPRVTQARQWDSAAIFTCRFFARYPMRNGS